MYFSENLRFLRQLRRGMTQENLAEQMGVSRQTVSKWESGAAYPELDKLIELCQYFNCSMDAMLCEAMNKLNDAYSNLRVETIAAFQYVRYTVISREPEHDAIRRIRSWADANKLRSPVVIGWDFPFLSQEPSQRISYAWIYRRMRAPAGFLPAGKRGRRSPFSSGAEVWRRLP